MKGSLALTQQGQHAHHMVLPPTPLTGGLSTKQSKYNKNFLGLVMPSSPALDHLAATMLMEFATA